MQCGFIGLGMLGARMARQVLEAGHDLKVFDLDPTAVEKLVAKGATGAASVTEAANQVDVLITCLPSPDASLKVMPEALVQIKLQRDNLTVITY